MGLHPERGIRVLADLGERAAAKVLALGLAAAPRASCLVVLVVVLVLVLVVVLVIVLVVLVLVLMLRCHSREVYGKRSSTQAASSSARR